jgi:sugar lactone lactonase YvrE
MRATWRCILVAVAAVGLAACAGSSQQQPPAQAAPRPSPIPSSAPGTMPSGVSFLYAFENTRGAVYYPLEGLAGIDYGDDGTLVFCDEKRSRVYGLDPRSQEWYEFDTPRRSAYRPVDVRIDGFKVLVLDLEGRGLDRYDLKGAYQDRIVNFRTLDPAYDTTPSAFDVDLDGRVVVADGGEDQIVMLDAFLALQTRIGGPGPQPDQFKEPSGVAFLPDGGFLVADRGNRRLQRFNRLGYYDHTIGGQFDLDNPFITPQGVDVDHWGNAFVADPAAGAVHVIDPDGQVVLTIGPGLDLLATPQAPMDVAVGPQGLLAVTDRTRGAVLVFQLLYD